MIKETSETVCKKRRCLETTVDDEESASRKEKTKKKNRDWVGVEERKKRDALSLTISKGRGERRKVDGAPDSARDVSFASGNNV